MSSTLIKIIIKGITLLMQWHIVPNTIVDRRYASVSKIHLVLLLTRLFSWYKLHDILYDMINRLIYFDQQSIYLPYEFSYKNNTRPNLHSLWFFICFDPILKMEFNNIGINKFRVTLIRKRIKVQFLWPTFYRKKPGFFFIYENHWNN